MSFPVSPIDGQQYSTALDTRYVYDSTRQAWLVDAQNVLGLTGLQGMTGIRGVTGILGIDGNTGVQGVTGFYGQTGIQGHTGLGIQGVTGLKGDQAFSMPFYWYDTTDVSTLPSQHLFIRDGNQIFISNQNANGSDSSALINFGSGDIISVTSRDSSRYHSYHITDLALYDFNSPIFSYDILNYWNPEPLDFVTEEIVDVSVVAIKGDKNSLPGIRYVFQQPGPTDPGPGGFYPDPITDIKSLYASKIDYHGNTIVSPFIETLKAGDVLGLTNYYAYKGASNNPQDSTAVYQLQVSGIPTDQGTYWIIPCSLLNTNNPTATSSWYSGEDLFDLSLMGRKGDTGYDLTYNFAGGTASGQLSTEQGCFNTTSAFLYCSIYDINGLTVTASLDLMTVGSIVTVNSNFNGGGATLSYTPVVFQYVITSVSITPSAYTFGISYISGSGPYLCPWTPIFPVGLNILSKGIQGETGLQGIDGSTGIQGETGIGTDGQTGIQGFQGQTGLGVQGTTGVAGINGVTGLQGIQGGTGISGITGLIGASGTTGLQGQTGIVGTQGTTGIAGSTGISGVTGIYGQTGIAGVTGVYGASGTTGLQGGTGIVGVTGVYGASGTTGLQGQTGVAGVTGIYGASGATGIAGVTGLQGSTGVAGNTGLQGMTGLGVQGETGIQGLAGQIAGLRLWFDNASSDMTIPTVVYTDLTWTNSGTNDFVTSPGGTFITDGWIVGRKVKVTGASVAGNNATYNVKTVTATVITFTSIATVTSDSDVGLSRLTERR